ncbi:MAG: hypothetical protein IJ794_13650 [Lachnospiraceae bacterium]|nr:hypothetical protein [Lachnospiraceae bacterium]
MRDVMSHTADGIGRTGAQKLFHVTRFSLCWMILGFAGTFPEVSEMLKSVYDDRWHYVVAGGIVALLWALTATRLKAMIYGLAAGVIAAAPAFAVKVTWISVILVLLSFLGAYAAGKTRGLTVSCVLFGVVFLAALIIQNLFGDSLSGLAFWADREISVQYQRWFGQSQNNRYENGDVIRGNDYLSNAVMLDVVVDRIPSDTIYLKGYTGVDYTGRKWTKDSETDFTVDHIAFSDQYGEKTWLQIRFECMVFMLNQGYMGDWPMMLRGFSPKDKEAKTMRLHTTPYYPGDYEPYFSLYARSAEYLHELAEGDQIDTWFFYEFTQLDPERMSRNEAYFSKKLLEVRAAYGAYVREKYLEVPERRLPGLTEICSQNPLTDLDEITAFIRKTVTEDSIYTRTPGITPVNRDVVEYFLFESRRGFCMHYASAATLMYRMYGVPARYVTGMVARPEDFTLQDDGTYAATLTDLRKHAWVEIYRDDYGWVPVEMTPVEYIGGEMAPAGWNMDTLFAAVGDGDGARVLATGAEIAVAEEEDEEEETEEQTDEDGEDEEDEEEEDIEETETGDPDTAAKARGTYGTYGAWVAVVLVAFVLGACIRRQVLVNIQKEMEVRRLFYRILKYMQWNGMLAGYSGLEKDFAEKMAEEVEGIDIGMARKFTETIMRAAYGNSPVSEEERQEVLTVYQKVDAEIYRGLTAVQKIDAGWIHVYHIF